jgi:hypothetical protein
MCWVSRIIHRVGVRRRWRAVLSCGGSSVTRYHRGIWRLPLLLVKAVAESRSLRWWLLLRRGIDWSLTARHWVVRSISKWLIRFDLIRTMYLSDTFSNLKEIKIVSAVSLPPSHRVCVFDLSHHMLEALAKETTKIVRSKLAVAISVSFIPPRCWDSPVLVSRWISVVVGLCWRFCVVLLFCVKQSWIDDWRWENYLSVASAVNWTKHEILVNEQFRSTVRSSPWIHHHHWFYVKHCLVE